VAGVGKMASLGEGTEGKEREVREVAKFDFDRELATKIAPPVFSEFELGFEFAPCAVFRGAKLSLVAAAANFETRARPSESILSEMWPETRRRKK